MTRFISVLIPPSSRQSTPVIKRTLAPKFPPESSTFDFPLYLSLGGLIGGRGLEAVVWDKVRELGPLVAASIGAWWICISSHSQDLMRKEYMGEVTIPLSEWFPSGQVSLWAESLTVSLLSCVLWGTEGFSPSLAASCPLGGSTMFRERSPSRLASLSRRGRQARTTRLGRFKWWCRRSSSRAPSLVLLAFSGFQLCVCLSEEWGSS